MFYRSANKFALPQYSHIRYVDSAFHITNTLFNFNMPPPLSYITLLIELGIKPRVQRPPSTGYGFLSKLICYIFYILR